VAYAGLVYGKAPFFYREVRRLMGDDAFFSALRSYADRYRFRTAPARGPLPVLSSGAHGAQVQRLARHWLDEAHGDQDLGPVDMKSVLGAMLGPDAATVAPQAEQIMRLLGPSTGAAPSPGSSGSSMPRDPAKVMKQLEQMLDSL